MQGAANTLCLFFAISLLHPVDQHRSSPAFLVTRFPATDGLFDESRFVCSLLRRPINQRLSRLIPRPHSPYHLNITTGVLVIFCLLKPSFSSAMTSMQSIFAFLAVALFD